MILKNEIDEALSGYDLKKVKIATEVNSLVRTCGGRRPMRSIKVKASKDKEGIVLVEAAK